MSENEIGRNEDGVTWHGIKPWWGDSPTTPWLPIESAPRDGTVILGCWPTFGSGGQHVGECEYAERWYRLGGKMLRTWWVPRGGPTAQEPTHWMPLPEPLRS